MKIIVTQKEIEALYRMATEHCAFNACEKIRSRKSISCKKCILNKFEIFELCTCDDPQKKAKGILKITEVKE